MTTVNFTLIDFWGGLMILWGFVLVCMTVAICTKRICEAIAAKTLNFITAQNVLCDPGVKITSAPQPGAGGGEVSR